MYLKLHPQSAPPNDSPERAEPQATTPTTVTTATYVGTTWFNLKAACATNVEVEVIAATLAACNWGHDLDNWLAEAEVDAPRMADHRGRVHVFWLKLHETLLRVFVLRSVVDADSSRSPFRSRSLTPSPYPR